MGKYAKYAKSQDAEDRDRIKHIKEVLVTKNMSYRALASQVSDPKRVRDKIGALQREVDTAVGYIAHLESILDSGSDDLDVMQEDIYSLEDELKSLVHKKDIARLSKIVADLLGAGIDVQNVEGVFEEGKSDSDDRD